MENSLRPFLKNTDVNWNLYFVSKYRIFPFFVHAGNQRITKNILCSYKFDDFYGNIIKCTCLYSCILFFIKRARVLVAPAKTKLPVKPVLQTKDTAVYVVLDLRVRTVNMVR